jgi:hypothetical protein
MSETKEIKIVFEEEEKEKEKKKIEKNRKKAEKLLIQDIFDTLKKNGMYHHHYDDTLLTESKNGMKTYINHISMSNRIQNHRPTHVEYSIKVNIGKLFNMQRIYHHIPTPELKSDDIRKHLLKIKEFKICNKCGHCMDETKECSCERSEKDQKHTTLLKTMLSMPIELEKCPICLEDIEEFNSIFFLKCEKPHRFHIQCLSKVKSPDCPICKSHCHRLSFRGNIFNFECSNYHEDDDYFSDDEDDYN